MRTERALMAVVAAGSIVLALTLATRVVTALTGWWATTIVVVVVAVSTVAFRVFRRRIPKGTVIEIDLDGGVVETQGSDPLSRAMTMRSATVRDIVDALERGAEDPRVTGVVAGLGNGGIGLGHAQELRDAVHRFRDSGKKAVAFPRQRAVPLPRREESSEPVDAALRGLVDMAAGLRQAGAGAHARMPWVGFD